MFAVGAVHLYVQLKIRHLAFLLEPRTQRRQAFGRRRLRVDGAQHDRHVDFLLFLLSAVQPRQFDGLFVERRQLPQFLCVAGLAGVGGELLVARRRRDELEALAAPELKCLVFLVGLLRNDGLLDHLAQLQVDLSVGLENARRLGGRFLDDLLQLALRLLHHRLDRHRCLHHELRRLQNPLA